ncbi:beta-ketoacyl-ACP synthase III [Hydrogenivirga sp. 128-5-R1-1]|uniref:beta-ketoacyl-ACP synthase III n=1 Tax=Hydrogenivirga sp. 128-5-R1-1 TaxID=392423 RepID=UPI00015F1866|nr:beta-ketoacyl-ACP synthase III [Hydrogenivirga sp. 128-5-R1-1]EDP75420.1 tryptophan synthase subunit beta [Hydrogenivirga sp. 128-5-R1-1]
MGTTIKGTGIYLPKDVLTNFDLEKLVDTSDEWITTRTGIKERRIAKEESVVEMSLKASLQALKNADLKAEDIDVVIVATLTPEKKFPSTGCLLQAELGVKRGYAFDLSAACSGFLYALEVSDGLLKSGKAKRVLVVGVEKLSEIVDWSDRSTCVLFGDGAGAVVLESSKGESDILASRMFSDGNLWDILYADKCGYIKMKGRELFKVAVRNMEEACREVLNAAEVSPEEVALVIPHQANVRIINALAEKLGIPRERVYVNIDRYGNTSAASIPIALHEAVEQGRLRRGDLVLMTAMGGGLTWGATLLRY